MACLPQGGGRTGSFGTSFCAPICARDSAGRAEDLVNPCVCSVCRVARRGRPARCTFAAKVRTEAAVHRAALLNCIGHRLGFVAFTGTVDSGGHSNVGLEARNRPRTRRWWGRSGRPPTSCQSSVRPAGSDQAGLVCADHQLGAISGAEFGHRSAGVGLGGRWAEVELAGDLFVRQP